MTCLSRLAFAILLAAAPAIAESPASPAAPASPASPASPSAPAEPQTVTGRFTTATEVKPILTATKSSWIAIREYDGQDLLYVTQIWSWRCGLVAMRVAVNGGAPEPWDLPPCHENTAQPNAITDDDGLPFRSYPLGSLQSVLVELFYDDRTTDSATFTRPQVLMP
ncbi:hypothetical protein GCM10011360_13400 [Primorskyibacter flagellatus]|uniref:Secreted protein n=1 Tax=Primorskyibacter flagellatus TaxID=1387277 RepID=A0A917A6J8_9RHOB|nr:hypothetical protein [Primorskyibacter flagellatus]GGE26324.1 hypothetical protein GCM10011360_13400 [Primorskyibacter flagellatus]